MVLEMNLISTTKELEAFCERAAAGPYVTADTEFIRERTYYSRLCLIQLAVPGKDSDSAVLVDPLAEGLSLDPLYRLFRDTDVVKVFHAARQDVEIFFIDGGVIPDPLFDTQVAAMVCGFSDQVGYETLVRKIVGKSLDKRSRFTDWSRRPLSDAQKKYALSDVTHLRTIYENLRKKLETSGRENWLEEDLRVLTSSETYIVKPDEAWRRIKLRGGSGHYLAVVRELAHYRECLAQSRDVPRNRIFGDAALLELASSLPRTMSDLSRSRLLQREARKPAVADGILAAIRRGLEVPSADCPRIDARRGVGQVNSALADLLRVLLKASSETAGVAQKLIATATDLDAIAAGERDLPALKGWRRDVFGSNALKLCDGRLALTADGREIRIMEI